MHFGEAKDALKAGISMIHQELLPIPYRSVMENVWLGRYPVTGFGPFKFVNHKKMLQDTKAIFEELKMEIDPATWVVNLSVSKMQSMEIAKAVSYKSKIIIMDEPTSSLTENEVGHLFRIIRKLRQEGVAIIYISHRMEEILKIADEVSIMRDGKLVGTYPAAELTTDLIINKMVGRDMSHRFPPRENVPSDEVVLRVEGFTSPDPKSFKDVSFDLRKGEILGVSGLVGAQRTELMETIFGLRPHTAGKLQGERQGRGHQHPRPGHPAQDGAPHRGTARHGHIRHPLGIRQRPRGELEVLREAGPPPRPQALRRGRQEEHRHAAREDTLGQGLHAEPLGRQPAEGHLLALAPHRAGDTHPRRADTRHRRRARSTKSIR